MNLHADLLLARLTGELRAETIEKALEEVEVERAKKKPYGDVRYADPGYQDDGVYRYPLDTETHVRAAWSYINQKANQKPYSADQLKKIKSRIKAAMKRIGAEVGE